MERNQTDARSSQSQLMQKEIHFLLAEIADFGF